MRSPRSEEVDLFKILIPKDSDWEIVSELGQFGVLTAPGKRAGGFGDGSALRVGRSEVGE